MADETQEKKKGGKARTATDYIALVEVEMADIPEQEGVAPNVMTVLEPLEGVFSAFRRDEVLDELVDSGKIAPDENTGKTPWVYITPARGFQRVRGTVEVTRRVVREG
jgi:hypothetical protein